MNNGVRNYIMQRQAEIDAAKLLSEAFKQAAALLNKAGVEDVEGTIEMIVDAINEE